MDAVIEYFKGLESRPVERLSIFAGGLMLLWFIESAIPYVNMSYKKSKVRHAAVNIGFTVIHFIIHTILAVVIVLLADWTQRSGFGLVHLLNAGIVATIIISALVMDFFAGWMSHIIEHKIPVFWRFHIIHHADNNVDVTTGLRHHPLESVWRGVFFFIGIIEETLSSELQYLQIRLLAHWGNNSENYGEQFSFLLGCKSLLI